MVSKCFKITKTGLVWFRTLMDMSRTASDFILGLNRRSCPPTHTYMYYWNLPLPAHTPERLCQPAAISRISGVCLDHQHLIPLWIKRPTWTCDFFRIQKKWNSPGDSRTISCRSHPKPFQVITKSCPSFISNVSIIIHMIQYHHECSTIYCACGY